MRELPRRPLTEVFEDNLTRLAQAEAELVRRLTEQAAEPGSVTRTRLEEMQRIMQPGLDRAAKP